MNYISANIVMGDYFIDFAHSVKYISTWKNLTDTCILEFPRNIQAPNEKMLDEVIKRGDAIAVDLGYDDVLVKRFTGFVDKVKPNNPVIITCEDEMWKWKQVPVKPKSFKNASLADILKHAGFTNFELLGDVRFEGTITIDRTVVSAAGVLEQLRKVMFQPSFFRNGKLYVGKPYNSAIATDHTFTFNYDIISHDLEYKQQGDVKLRVEYISKQMSGKELKYAIGDNTGETHTIHGYNVPKSQMQARANEAYQQLTYTGWRGKFKTFGEPIVQHGDIITLVDPLNGEKGGSYYAERVEVIMDTTQAYKQEITLGYKTGTAAAPAISGIFSES